MNRLHICADCGLTIAMTDVEYVGRPQTHKLYDQVCGKAKRYSPLRRWLREERAADHADGLHVPPICETRREALLNGTWKTGFDE